MNVRSFTFTAIVVWFIAVFALAAAGGFITQPGTPPIAIGLGATLPLVVFFAAYARSYRFRDFVRSADLRLLTGIQAWRAGGLGFIALWAHGVLPGLFAWPAALGDIAIGVTAPWIARALTGDRAFVGTARFAVWNWLGILDLVIAVSMGVLSSGVVPGLTPVTTAAMGSLPLALIPAYFVPLFVMLHAVALFRAREAQKREAYFGHGGVMLAP
jgi:hypothetical protein